MAPTYRPVTLIGLDGNHPDSSEHLAKTTIFRRVLSVEKRVGMWVRTCW